MGYARTTIMPTLFDGLCMLALPYAAACCSMIWGEARPLRNILLLATTSSEEREKVLRFLNVRAMTWTSFAYYAWREGGQMSVFVLRPSDGVDKDSYHYFRLITFPLVSNLIVPSLEVVKLGIRKRRRSAITSGCGWP